MDRADSDEHSSIELKQIPSYGTSNGKALEAGEPDRELDQVDLEIPGSNGTDSSTQGESETSTAVSSDSEGEDKKKKRETWDNKFQFILSLIGYAVGLGNVWRFSYLCAKNGGSAFLFPYLIMLFVLGIPLFYLELTLGQGTKKGPVGAWKKISPNLMGIGVAAVIVNSYICLYYNVIIAWVIYYFFNSFTSNLPWGNCFGYTILDLNDTQKMEILRNNTGPEWSSCFNSSTEYYWYNTALEASDNIGVAATFNWRLFLCLAGAWVIIYLCLFRGIQSSGKIIYFTAIFPYIVLVCLFFRAVTLEGAGEGLKFLFLPADGWTDKILDPVVWLDAATQIFFSLGLSIGALVALASYSKPRNNALVDSVVVCLMNSGTSIFASIIVFSVVGFRAVQLGIDVELVSEGPGLAFIIFSAALLRMPGAPFWALMFFIMLFLLGLDSQFATMEGVLTVLRDMKTFRKIRKELLVALVCLVFFLVSIPFILGNGVYLFSLFDTFAAGVPLLLIGFFEFIAVAWVFGMKNYFSTYAKAYHPFMRYIWTALWKWIDPIIMVIIFLASVLREVIEPLMYAVYRNYEEERTRYPEWALFVGSMIVLSSVLLIPIILIGRLIAYQQARDDAKEFFRTLKVDAKIFWADFKIWIRALPSNTRQWIIHLPENASTCCTGCMAGCHAACTACVAKLCRCLTHRRYTPHIDEDDDTIPVYRHMDEADGEVPSFSTHMDSEPPQ